MPWVLDGNNLARGHDRSRVRTAALALARQERVRILVFFDGAPPPGVPGVERLGSIEVRYVPHADSAILGLLQGGDRGWRLATDDRALAARARGLGAEVVPAAEFMSRVERALASSGGGDEARPDMDGAQAGPGKRLPDAPTRVRRSPRNRRHW